MAVSRHEPASKHDYEIHKSQFHNYLNYLLKLPDEVLMVPSDAAFQHWVILCDLGYIGPAHHTPDVCHVTPVKVPCSTPDFQYNDDVAKHCVG